MKVHYWHTEAGNFGDELNEWLWQRVLPIDWSDDGTILIGIGTILDRAVPAARIRAVMGTGTGYAALPQDLTDPSWRIYGVRGPISAKLLGLGPDKALTDPAILLAGLPDFQVPQNGPVVFVPHWQSTIFGAWPGICRKLGIKFIDPCGPSSTAIIKEIISARLVLAESLHAAIIADAFRIPWIPVALSSDVSAFKWLDWTLSKGMAYKPICLPASDWVEALRHRLLSLRPHLGLSAWPKGPFLRSQPVVIDDGDKLVGEFRARTGGKRRSGLSRKLAKLAEIAVRRLARLNRKVRFAPSRREAVEALTELAKMPGETSADRDHALALGRMQAALGQLEADWKQGFKAPA